MSILVPNCVNLSADTDTIKSIMEKLIGWMKGGNLEWFSVVHSSASSGDDDRVLITDGEQNIWMGITDTDEVSFMLDPEKELSDSSVPSEGGTRSKMRTHSTTILNGDFLFAEYPDAFMFHAQRVDQSTHVTGLLVHGGKVITTWNGSDADRGITGHALFKHATGRWSSGMLLTSSFTMRLDHDLWAPFDNKNGYVVMPDSPWHLGLRPNYPALNPIIVGPQNGSTGVGYRHSIGYLRYSRVDATPVHEQAYGLQRVSLGDSSQSWLCLTSDASTGYGWWLWDSNVAV